MKKRVLLFGGSGMVGRELIRALENHTVVAPSHAQVDITDTALIEQLIVDEKPDFIINAAAIINMNAIEQDSSFATRVNVQGASAIAHTAAAHSIPQLLVSSSYVFSDSALARAEDAVKNPTSKYGKTKAEAEDAVAECGSRAPYYIARSSWFYSRYRTTFVDEVAQTLLQDKSFESSAQRGNPTYGADFALSVVKNFIDSSAPSGVYHIVNEGDASRYEIVRGIARALHVSEDLAVAAKEFSLSTLRPSVLLINTKLPKLPPWEESLRSYLTERYLQKH